MVRGIGYKNIRKAMHELRDRVRMEMVDDTLVPKSSSFDPDVEFHICCQKLMGFIEIVGSRIVLKNSRLKALWFSRLCHLIDRVTRIYSTTNSHQASFFAMLDSVHHKLSSIDREFFCEFKNMKEKLLMEDDDFILEDDEIMEFGDNKVENCIEQKPPEIGQTGEVSLAKSTKKNVNAFTRTLKLKRNNCSSLKFQKSFQSATIKRKSRQLKGSTEALLDSLEEKPPDAPSTFGSVAFRSHKIHRRPSSRFHSCYKRGKKKTKAICSICKVRLPAQRASKHLARNGSPGFTSGNPVPEDHKMFRKKTLVHQLISRNIHEQQGRERIIEGIDPGPANQFNCQ
jgi:hypothetical protein